MSRLRKRDLLVREFPLRRPRAAQPRFMALEPQPRENAGFHTRQVHRVERPPFCAIGVLVAADCGSTTTAWLIGPDRILTAAHPLKAGRSYYFGLQYSGPQGGVWARLIQAHSLEGWLENRDHRCDMAVCRLDREFAVATFPPQALPERLPSRCQVLGYAFGTATLWQSYCRDLHWSPEEASVSTDLSEGSSGGPWFIRHQGLYLPVGLTSRGGDGFLLSPAWRSWEALQSVAG